MRLEQQKIGRSHQWIDRRSLALAEAIVAKLRVQPELLQLARETLQNWIQQRQPAVPYALTEWQEILTNQPFDDILALLISPDPEPTRLRQSNPFCGILTQQERMQIFQDYETRRA